MLGALIDFIKDCYKAGKGHSEIRTTLKDSGWATEQIDEALGQFVDKAYPVAIPRPEVFACPRLLILNLFHFTVLFLSTYNVVAMLFTYLDYYVPDPLGRREGFYFSSVRIGVALRDNLATLICCVPLVWWSSRIISKAMEGTKQRIPRIRRQFICATMVLGACVMLAQGITFVYHYLSGELGLRFFLKVLILTALYIGWLAYYHDEIKELEAKV